MTPTAYAWVAAFFSVVSAGGTWRLYVAWRSVLQRLELKTDLCLMHEKRAEMYRAFLIERTCCEHHKQQRIDTFGGAR